MAFSRYTRSPVLNFGAQLGTSRAKDVIYNAVKSGQLQTREVILRGVERLDTLAGEIYGDGRYYWVLAAASGIGWCLQVPPGTVIRVPELKDVASLVA